MMGPDTDTDRSRERRTAGAAELPAGSLHAQRRPAVIPEFPAFQPCPWLRSGHLQTIVGAYAPQPRIAYGATVRVVDLPDGERLALHDDRPAGWSAGGRCVLLLHGLGGCHRSPYMIRMADRLMARNIRVFRMDMRGHGAGVNLAGRPGHAGRGEDVQAAVRWIAGECPQAPIGLAGISLGGNVILKLLGDAGPSVHPQVDRALAVAPPIDLQECSRLIQRFRSRLYDRAFVQALMRQVERQRVHWPAIAALDLRVRPRTLWDFDDRVTAPLAGFRGAEHYYQQASAAPGMANVAVPTTILTAADDPLVPPHVFLRANLSEFVSLRITDHGGHVGYLGVRGVDADRRWLDWRVVDWATATLEPVRP